MNIKISLTVIFLLIFTLAFANIYAEKNQLTPITDIRLEMEYDTKEDYFDDFCQKSNESGTLFYAGLRSFLGGVPKAIGDVKDVIDGIVEFFTDVVNWFEDVFSFFDPMPPYSGGGGGGFRSR